MRGLFREASGEGTAGGGTVRCSLPVFRVLGGNISRQLGRVRGSYS